MVSKEENRIKQLFSRPHKKIIGTRGGLDKYYYAQGLREIWEAFDAFLSFKFPAANNKAMRDLLCNKHQSVFIIWKMSDSFNFSVERLNHWCPIYDLSTQNPKPPITNINRESLSEILKASYRIRSNLSHGKMSMEDTKDRELVENALKVTHEILYKISKEEGLGLI